MPGLKIAIVPVTPFEQNCTLLWDEPTKAAVVIDPGGDVDRILAELTRQSVTVDAIWLTHGHLDHAGGVEDLRDALRADGKTPPVIGPDRHDEDMLANLSVQGAMFGVRGMRNVSPDRWLTEGESLHVGPHRFDILHCPGHTPGHIVFYNEAERFAQVGDVLFRGSVGRTDFPYSEPAALITAIKTKLLPLGDDVRFVCGHGPGSTIGAERRSNPYIQ